VSGGTARTAAIPARHLGGAGFDPSVIVLGTSSFGDLDRAAPVYDRYVALGGNLFDTAWVYGQSFEPGCCERVLGTWMSRRGLTGQVRLIVKGGHPPHCRPGALRGQLAESLDRLQQPAADIYMVHRDDTDVPVDEWVDVLRSFVEYGLTTAYGFSNWTVERAAAAIAYARRHDHPEPIVLSNQLSLAVMERPVYPGCLSVADPASRRWLEEAKFAVMPWSSQGRGVFTRVADRLDLETGELAASWFSPQNWERITRTRKLAVERGVLPVNVALAWVLQQPFPTFPIIGPRTADELNSAIRALDISLSPDEMAWLNLEAEG
jgi:aryl-alcohol dehydrogenase-like predicted oxidoreductase